MHGRCGSTVPGFGEVQDIRTSASRAKVNECDRYIQLTQFENVNYTAVGPINVSKQVKLMDFLVLAKYITVISFITFTVVHTPYLFILFCRKHNIYHLGSL